MPDGLAEAAYQLIHGKFTDDQRVGVFKPEMAVADDAPPQARLLAYTGRDSLPEMGCDSSRSGSVTPGPGAASAP